MFDVPNRVICCICSTVILSAPILEIFFLRFIIIFNIIITFQPSGFQRKFNYLKRACKLKRCRRKHQETTSSKDTALGWIGTITLSLLDTYKEEHNLKKCPFDRLIVRAVLGWPRWAESTEACKSLSGWHQKPKVPTLQRRSISQNASLHQQLPLRFFFFCKWAPLVKFRVHRACLCHYGHYGHRHYGHLPLWTPLGGASRMFLFDFFHLT